LSPPPPNFHLRLGFASSLFPLRFPIKTPQVLSPPSHLLVPLKHTSCSLSLNLSYGVYLK
jgi:hypothetical protein